MVFRPKPGRSITLLRLDNRQNLERLIQFIRQILPSYQARTFITLIRKVFRLDESGHDIVRDFTKVEQDLEFVKLLCEHLVRYGINGYYIDELPGIKGSSFHDELIVCDHINLVDYSHSIKFDHRGESIIYHA